MTDILRVGHIDLGFHDASARVVEQILRDHGHAIARSAAPHEAMFERLGRGEIDMLVSAWLPASHGGYLAPMRDAVEAITVLYEPYCIWGVPAYVPEDQVAAVADLMRPAVLERMTRRIQGINPGAGISRFSARMIDAYGLAQHGYAFHTGSQEECFSTFERAVAEGRWVIVPLWHPQWLHARHAIRALAEPLGLLGGTDKATLIVRKDALPRIAPAALTALRTLHLGNAAVSRLDLARHLEEGY